jgi:hypothetical protein
MRISAARFESIARLRVIRLAAVWLVLLAGCDAARVPTSPEARAREFLEVAIRDPQNSERLALLAGDPAYATATGLDSAPVRVALDYLRSRHALGTALDFKSGRAQALDNGAQRVPVAVQPAPGSNTTVGFEVEIEPAGDGWRIRRVTIPG